MMRQLNQAGDTIVEVMIAIAITSTVLGGSYAAVNSTTGFQQQTLEHTEALNFLQAQVEHLKSASNDENNDAQVFGTGPYPRTPYCFDESGAYTPITATSLPTAFTNYPPGCKAGTDNRYNVGIIQVSANLFQIYANWDGAAGKPQQVNIVYRLYP